MGGGLPTLVQAWISARPSMIVMPILILPFLFLFSSTPWWKMIFSRIVVVYVLSFCVSWRQHQFLPFAIIMPTIFSNLSVPDRPCTFWFRMVHAYGQVSPELVVVHTPCPGEHEYSSAVVDFHDGESKVGCSLLRGEQPSSWFLGQKTPTIFLSHSHWFHNWKFLVQGGRSRYAPAIHEVTPTTVVLSRWNSVADDNHRWNHLQVLKLNNIAYHTKPVRDEKPRQWLNTRAFFGGGDDDWSLLFPSSGWTL